MLQLSIREFNKNISKSFKTLPVEITLRGYVVARIIPPGWFWKEVVEKAGEKYKADAIKTITKINVVKPNGTPMPAPAETEAKNAGERSSDTPSGSAPPPPTAGGFPGVHPIPKPNADTITIPTLRKKLCPKHSVFSCGCKEKE